jgi:hypothetical protein
VISRFPLGRSESGSRRSQTVGEGKGRVVRANDCEEVIAEFIRTRGITRCPTACVLPTQGAVDAADRAALEEHAVAQERVRQARAAARARLFWSVALTTPGEK